eukprot:EG_transcript_39895
MLPTVQHTAHGELSGFRTGTACQAGVAAGTREYSFELVSQQRGCSSTLCWVAMQVRDDPVYWLTSIEPVHKQIGMQSNWCMGETQHLAHTRECIAGQADRGV